MWDGAGAALLFASEDSHSRSQRHRDTVSQHPAFPERWGPSWHPMHHATALLFPGPRGHPGNPLNHCQGACMVLYVLNWEFCGDYSRHPLPHRFLPRTRFLQVPLVGPSHQPQIHSEWKTQRLEAAVLTLLFSFRTRPKGPDRDLSGVTPTAQVYPRMSNRRAEGAGGGLLFMLI